MKVCLLRLISLFKEITMPSRQYYLSVSDETIVELDRGTGANITARKYGQTTITLLDKSGSLCVD